MSSAAAAAILIKLGPLVRKMAASFVKPSLCSVGILTSWDVADCLRIFELELLQVVKLDTSTAEVSHYIQL